MNSQQMKMKTCNADAKTQGLSGDARKQFMSNCLKGVLIMGLLDGLIGGAVGAEMITVVNQLIAKHGGLPGIVSQLQQQGLGPTVSSWIGTGPNQPISPTRCTRALAPKSCASWRPRPA